MIKIEELPVTLRGKADDPAEYIKERLENDYINEINKLKAVLFFDSEQEHSQIKNVLELYEDFELEDIENDELKKRINEIADIVRKLNKETSFLREFKISDKERYLEELEKKEAEILNLLEKLIYLIYQGSSKHDKEVNTLNFIGGYKSAKDRCFNSKV